MNRFENIYMMPQTKCPACRKEFTAASALHGEPPSAGDITVCIECLHWMVFRDDMTVRSMTQNEIDALSPGEFWDVMQLVNMLTKAK